MNLAVRDLSGEEAGTSTYKQYRHNLIRGFWEYTENCLENAEQLLDGVANAGTRPPVFREEASENNILVPHDAPPSARKAVLHAIPPSGRHRWFRSMNSSQALAQSVFGNLIALSQTNVLAEVLCDDGLPVLGAADLSSGNFQLEQDVHWLGEPRPTSVDVMFNSGSYRVAIECKLTEQEVGSCSFAKTKSGSPARCNGNFECQNGRQARCALAERGVEYWDYVPSLFHWDADQDRSPCLLASPYQLVRNILAACVREDKSVKAEGGHAVLLYDERNPEFRDGGKAFIQVQQVRTGLRSQERLRTCTWQAVMTSLEGNAGTAPVAKPLRAKYGF